MTMTTMMCDHRFRHDHSTKGLVLNVYQSNNDGMSNRTVCCESHIATESFPLIAYHFANVKLFTKQTHFEGWVR